MTEALAAQNRNGSLKSSEKSVVGEVIVDWESELGRLLDALTLIDDAFSRNSAADRQIAVELVSSLRDYWKRLEPHFPSLGRRTYKIFGLKTEEAQD